MKICLIFPPSSDPTAPYISLPTLAAYLRTHDIQVLCIDANVEAYERLLTKDSLKGFGRRLEQGFKRLDRKKALDHCGQLTYAHLWKEKGLTRSIPYAIEDALCILRDKPRGRFYDANQYAMAVEVVEAALKIISAAYSPLKLDFSSCRKPFSFLTAEDIRVDAQPEKNPFYDYFSNVLLEQLKLEKFNLIGISAVFPGQLQPSYSLALLLRKALPDTHITIGGPAISQLLVNIDPSDISCALGPFHSGIIFEGEYALLNLSHRIEKGENVTGVLWGNPVQDMSMLPAPDFDGMPLEKYLSPVLVLPYDPSRGCYWGRCSFCHYGLSKHGTARYRERPVERIVDHLGMLSEKYGTSIFYFTEDTMAPRLAIQISDEIKKKRLNLKWATDMRPERSLTPDNCRKMADGGALCLTFGIESASPRVLKLMDKGVRVNDMKDVIMNAAKAKIAVEVMCFTGFPTETYAESMRTIQFINELYEYISLFICGEFQLTNGSRIAISPQKYGIKEIWHVEGDRFRTGIFYEEKRYAKSPKEKNKEERAIADISRRWQLSRYPWAGSLSTAHTFLWYDRFGPEIFKKSYKSTKNPDLYNRYNGPSRFDIAGIIRETQERENEIWETLVRRERRVSRQLYRAFAKKTASLFPRTK